MLANGTFMRPGEEIIRQAKTDGWEAYLTPGRVLVYHDNGLGERQVVLQAGRDEVRQVAQQREMPWLLVLIGIASVLPFYLSFLVQGEDILPGAALWVYALSPLFFLGGLAFIGYQFFAPKLLHITLRDNRVVKIPGDFTNLFDGIVGRESCS